MRISDHYGLGHLILRVGLAFAFLYPPIAALGDPIAWSGYFPHFVHSLPIDTFVLLHAFGVLEVTIAIWILYGKHLKIPAVLAALLLVGIVAFNLQDFGILFRDLTIAFLAIALAVLPEPGKLATR